MSSGRSGATEPDWQPVDSLDGVPGILTPDDGLLWISAGKALRDGEACSHPGCLAHLSHPCEGCGRIGGVRG